MKESDVVNVKRLRARLVEVLKQRVEVAHYAEQYAEFQRDFGAMVGKHDSMRQRHLEQHVKMVDEQNDMRQRELELLRDQQRKIHQQRELLAQLYAKQEDLARDMVAMMNELILRTYVQP